MDMPPLGGMMSDEQVADVVNYVRTHFGNDYRDRVSAAAVTGGKTAKSEPLRAPLAKVEVQRRRQAERRTGGR